MWQFAEACRGLKDACLELGVPVTGGNVSLYNQTGEVAILPTPVVAVLGVIDDVTRRTPSGFVAPGEQVFLLGETREELSGSEWAHVVHGHLGGLPPQVDLAAEKALAALLADAVGLVTSAHDLSDGGLAQALVEAALRADIGATVALPGDAFLDLFAESAARAIVTVPEAAADRLSDLAARHGVPLTRIGTTGGPDLTVEGEFTVPLSEVREAWSSARCPRPSGDLQPSHALDRLLRRRPQPVRRDLPPVGGVPRRGRGDPRRLLEGGVRRLARPAARHQPGRRGLDRLEPGVPPGRQRRRRAGDPRRRGRGHRRARRRRGARHLDGDHPRSLGRWAPRHLGGVPRPLRAVAAGAGPGHRGRLPGRRPRPARRPRPRSGGRCRRGVPRPSAGAGRRPGGPAPAGPARRTRPLRPRPRRHRRPDRASPSPTSKRRPPRAATPS